MNKRRGDNLSEINLFAIKIIIIRLVNTFFEILSATTLNVIES